MREPGISSSYFGPGASRPVIRGLGEDRIRVLQNGVATIDVSNVSPDHAVSAEPLTIKTIDVVRGPATLLYGPNTVGGVVNLIDNLDLEEVIARAQRAALVRPARESPLTDVFRLSGR